MYNPFLKPLILKEPLKCKTIIGKKNGVEVDGVLYSHIETNNFGIHAKGCIDLTDWEKSRSIFEAPKFQIDIMKIIPNNIFNIVVVIALISLKIELHNYEEDFKYQYHKLQTIKEWCITHNKLAFCEDFFGEYVRGNTHTNTIEGFWSQFKRSVHGTFHCVSPKHLQAYLDEFSFRYNHRDASLPCLMFSRVSMLFPVS